METCRTVSVLTLTISWDLKGRRFPSKLSPWRIPSSPGKPWRPQCASLWRRPKLRMSQACQMHRLILAHATVVKYASAQERVSATARTRRTEATTNMVRKENGQVCKWLEFVVDVRRVTGGWVEAVVLLCLKNVTDMCQVHISLYWDPLLQINTNNFSTDPMMISEGWTCSHSWGMKAHWLVW